MQNANLSAVQSDWVPAEVVNVAENPISALIAAMTNLSPDEIETLEDEINFFAFTGLKGDLFQDVLNRATNTEKPSNPSGFSGYAGKISGQRGKSKLTASTPSRVLECAFE